MDRPQSSRGRISIIALAWMSAVLSGIVLGFSFPPDGRGILAWVALVPLLHALTLPGFTPLIRLGLGWVAGLFFVCTILWRVHDIFDPVWDPSFEHWNEALLKLYFHIALVSLVGSLPLAIFSLGAGFFLTISCTATSVLLTAALWTGLEYLLGTWISSTFEWYPLGHTLDPGNPLAQNADLLGLYGLGFLVVVCNLAILVYFTRPRTIVRWLPLLFVLTTIATLFHRGGAILYSDNTQDTERRLDATLFRFDPEQPEVGRSLTAVSLGSSKSPSTQLLIWPAPPPESSLALDDDTLRSMVKSLSRDTPDRPLAWLLWPASDSTKLATFSTSKDTTRTEVAPVSPPATLSIGTRDTKPWTIGILAENDLKCPTAARKLTRQNAELLAASLNENDVFTANELALAYVRSAFRAIENRRWLLRCSASGVSACIDPRGQSQWLLSPQVHGDLRETVTAAVGTTVFTSWGWLFAPTCLVSALIGLICQICRPKGCLTGI